MLYLLTYYSVWRIKTNYRLKFFVTSAIQNLLFPSSPSSLDLSLLSVCNSLSFIVYWYTNGMSKLVLLSFFSIVVVTLSCIILLQPFYLHSHMQDVCNGTCYFHLPACFISSDFTFSALYPTWLNIFAPNSLLQFLFYLLCSSWLATL